MTDAKVVDASAIAAVLFDEPAREATVERLRGATLYAPALLQFEVASVALKKIRERPTEREPLLSALNALPATSIEYVEIDMAAAIDLARAATLSLYDGCYLWLARDLCLELVTLDSRLAKAATRLHAS